MTVGGNVRIERSRLGTLTRLSAGGQGVVYAAPALRMQYASALVYKEYKPQAISGLDVSVLEAMPEYLESLPFADGMELLSMSAWPCRLVEDAGSVVGFVMPAIPREFFIDIKKVSGVQSEAAKWHLLLNGDSYLARRQIPLTDRHRYELLADAATGLAVLHRHGIAVGDFSPNNLLFSISPHARAFFIDCDAMRFHGRSSVKQLETPDWEVRAVNSGEELGTEASDSYKFALLALRLFAGDQSTRDPKRLPAHVPKGVRDLVSEGLSKSPSARPTPSVWVQPLLTAAISASTAPPSVPTPVAKAVPVAQPTPSPAAPVSAQSSPPRTRTQPNRSVHVSASRPSTPLRPARAVAAQPAMRTRSAKPAYWIGDSMWPLILGGGIAAIQVPLRLWYRGQGAEGAIPAGTFPPGLVRIVMLDHAVEISVAGLVLAVGAWFLYHFMAERAGRFIRATALTVSAAGVVLSLGATTSFALVILHNAYMDTHPEAGLWALLGMLLLITLVPLFLGPCALIYYLVMLLRALVGKVKQ